MTPSSKPSKLNRLSGAQKKEKAKKGGSTEEEKKHQSELEATEKEIASGVVVPWKESMKESLHPTEHAAGDDIREEVRRHRKTGRTA